MKKLLLPALLLGLGFTVSAQQENNLIRLNTSNRSDLLRTMPLMKIDADVSPEIKVNPLVKSRSGMNKFNETLIGSSIYDLQTNSSTGTRIIKHDDGNISAVWTMAHQSGYADRGTGYNFYNGTSWSGLPTTRIENDRTGWPYIGVTANGKEHVFSHNTTIDVIHHSSRATKGTGAWTQSTTAIPSAIPEGNYWPRIAVSGNYIHIIAITYPVASGGQLYQGQNGALVYSRSSDGGQTWDILNHIIPEIDINNYLGFSADDYAIDAREDIVVIAFGGWRYDVGILKSTDRGTTWSKTIASQFPIPLYDQTTMITDIDNDGIADTLYTCDGSIDIALDKNNKTHLSWGRMRVIDSDEAGNMSYFPYMSRGLMYWNEIMTTSAPILIADLMDRNDDGEFTFPQVSSGTWPFGTYYASLTSHPSIVCDEKEVYITFSAVVEDVENTGISKLYRHMFITKAAYTDLTTWQEPVDMIIDEYTEAVFGSAAKNSDDYIHLIYQQDPNPGHALSGTPAGSIDPDNVGKPSEIVYVKIPKSLTVGIEEVKKEDATHTLFPNPAKNHVMVNLNSSNEQVATFSILNFVGQTVFFQNVNLTSGVNSVQINTQNLNPGLYLVSVNIGGQDAVSKLVIQ
ncbi:MAG: T9SS type A sorting domain-containing protein [Bacteroidetes bacterium]|nr:T9SS type A sorting domain-containing protein [Bacteroidota bacterium]